MKPIREVKSFKQIIEAPEVQQQPVVVSFLRLNPPTKEHGIIIQKVLDLAEESEADHMIFLSQSVDPEMNPLECEAKVEFLKQYFPHVNFICDSKMSDPHSMLEHLNKKKYKDVIVVVDPDRFDQTKEFEHLIGHDKVFQFEAFRVEKADASDGDSSAKLIQLAKADKFKQFLQGTPNPALQDVGTMMFDAVKGGKKLK